MRISAKTYVLPGVGKTYVFAFSGLGVLREIPSSVRRKNTASETQQP
jgi:hypothetical protein